MLRPRPDPDEKERARLREEAQGMTRDLRKSNAGLWTRIRSLVVERGVDVGKSWLVQFHTEDTDNWLGILVTAQSRVFLFQYDWFDTTEDAGRFKEWRELTGLTSDIEYKAFRHQIESGLSIAAE